MEFSALGATFIAGLVAGLAIGVVLVYWAMSRQVHIIQEDEALKVARRLADSDLETVRTLYADKGHIIPLLRMWPCGHFWPFDIGLECPACKDKHLRSSDMLLLPSTPEGMFKRWWGAAYPSAKTHCGRVARNVFKDGWDAALLVSGNWKEERNGEESAKEA